MARTIAEIKKGLASSFVSNEDIRSQYGLADNVTFDQAFSKVSIESVLLYVVASCMWVVESLFDCHKKEVDEKIESLRPHTLRWYVAKTKQYIKGENLIMKDGLVVADYYDYEEIKKRKNWTDERLAAAPLVKYAVATEDNTNVYIKVAKDKGGLPTQLEDDELKGLESYISQIKDAGVFIKILNQPADKMKVSLIVLYDPVVITPTNVGSEDSDQYRTMTIKEVTDAVRKVITELPFNGEYRNSDLIAAVQAVEGVKVADIVEVRTAPGGTDDFHKIVAYHRPYSGYYSLADGDITIRGRAYKVAE